MNVGLVIKLLVPLQLLRLFDPMFVNELILPLILKEALLLGFLYGVFGVFFVVLLIIESFSIFKLVYASCSFVSFCIKYFKETGTQKGFLFSLLYL